MDREPSPDRPRPTPGPRPGSTVRPGPTPRGTPTDEAPVRPTVAPVDDATEPVPPVTESPATEVDRPQPGRARRVLTSVGKVLVALLSVVTLVGTGVGYVTLDNAKVGTTDVLSGLTGAPEAADGATDILLVGNDSRTDTMGNPLPPSMLKELRTEATSAVNTDTIIVLRVPTNGGKAFAISIPRDTSVPIPGYREDKINAVYGVTKTIRAEQLREQGVTDRARVETESDQAGRRALVQVVHEITDLRIDHYAEINLMGFYLLTEALGGVEVCLLNATSDSDSGARFREGRQTIKGGDALAFVRQRKNLPRGDLDRIVRQQVFMGAVMNKLLSSGTLTDPRKVGELMSAGKRSVVLDEQWDLLGFADRMRSLASGDVEFVTIPVTEIDARNDRGQSIVRVDRDQVRRFVRELLGGTTDPPPTPSTTTTTTPPAPPVRPVVEVRNATPRQGLAAQVSRKLDNAGLRTRTPVNTAVRSRSSVRTAPGERSAAEPVAQVLGDLQIIEDVSIGGGTVAVVLGADFRLPGGHFAPRRAPAPNGVAELGPESGTRQDPVGTTAQGGPHCVN